MSELGHPPLTVTRQPEPGGVRLLVAGELDLSTVETLSSALREHRDGRESVLLDLSQLEFVDSTGLRLLLEAAADARRDGWGVSVRRDLAPQVRRLLDLTDAWTLFDWE